MNVMHQQIDVFDRFVFNVERAGNGEPGVYVLHNEEVAELGADAAGYTVYRYKKYSVVVI
jgi:hypothetical protein